MTLTAKDVAQITRLLEESTFDELDLEIDGLKLSLKRGGAAASPAAQADARSTTAPAPTAAAPPHAAAAGSGQLVIKAPMLGTFYRAPKPGAPPFVDVGSRVEADTIVAIIEVMKLMNTIRAGVTGTVAEILGEDGDLVEYGEVLMRVAADPA